MASNPWKFKALEFVNWYGGPFEVKIILMKRDIRGGYDLGRIKKGTFVIVENVDFRSKDRLYWKELFKTILNAGSKWSVKVPRKRAEEVIKDIRWIRYQERRPRFKTWDARYGKRVADWARKIVKASIDDPCVDNYRLARKGDKKAVFRYKLQRESGCCGSFDVVRRCPYDWFREYYIGCNYGH